MAKLITGGSGFIGSELARRLLSREEDVVVFDRLQSTRLHDMQHKLTVVLGDLHNWPELFNVVKNYRIDAIYHLGSMLTFESEANPWGSFQTNVVGTLNVLEAARLLNVEKVMFTSSIGTFGPGIAEITDVTLQRPDSFYGIGKLYCEGMFRFYRRRFGLDCRSIRYPAVVGPGVTTPNHWHAPMIQHAALGKNYACPVSRDVAEPRIYFKDAVRAADGVLSVPREQVRMVNYNVGGSQAVSAKVLEEAIRKHLPDAKITYPSLPTPSPWADVQTWDDSYARKEWGWDPAYPKVEQFVSDFITEIQSHPERYQT